MEYTQQMLDVWRSRVASISDWTAAKAAEEAAGIDMGGGRARHELAALFGELLPPALDDAAVTSEEFYNVLRLAVLGDELAMQEPYKTPFSPYVSADRAMKLGADASSAVRSVVGAEVRRAAGGGMYGMGERDPEKPRFARVPKFTASSGMKAVGRSGHVSHNKFLRENGTCLFCIMLASRGPVYHTAKTAGIDEGHYHERCDCAIVPVWGSFDYGPSRRRSGTYIEGYSDRLDEYYDMYLKGVSDGTLRGIGGSRGYSAKFKYIGDMIDYLRASTDVDDLQARASVVAEEFDHLYPRTGDRHGSLAPRTRAWDSLSHIAKEEMAKYRS